MRKVKPFCSQDFVMPTFGTLDTSSAVRALADGSLTQLYRSSAFAGAGVTALSNRDLGSYFEKGQDVTLSRPKDLGVAQDYDPRSGSDADVSDADHLLVSLLLEKLFTKGFSVYSHDADVARYVRDYSVSTGGAVRKSFDDYLYTKAFRTWSLAASGDVLLSKHPPVQITFSETSGGVLNDFSDQILRSAGATLNAADVPDTGRFARLSARAAEAYMGAITPVTGSALTQGSLALGAAGLIESPYMTRDFDMRGFMIRGSNAITGQTAVADTGDGVAFEPISAYAAASGTDEFFFEDQATETAVGAVRVTVNQTANLAAGIAVGKIARIGAADAAALAYGVILRVDAANKYVWLVPYNSAGEVVTAAELTAASGTINLSVPQIGSVNVGYHREHLAYATRLLTPPDPGDGATAEASIDIDTGLAMQVFKGTYNVHRFSGGIRTALLCGATPTDMRKGVLMLSN
jgi:hypothetical protein